MLDFMPLAFSYFPVLLLSFCSREMKILFRPCVQTLLQTARSGQVTLAAVRCRQQLTPRHLRSWDLQDSGTDRVDWHQT